MFVIQFVIGAILGGFFLKETGNQSPVSFIIASFGWLMSWVAMTILCKRHKYKSDIPDNMLLLFFATIFVIPCIYFGSSLGRMLCGGIVISGIFTTLKQIKFITRHIINKNVS